ncbi:MAG TPA: Fe-S protein assembly co-chaperone HscB [Nitrospiria bacterium]|nr:Fe-S protein assembly co-chaperone HscB [Nitrospiria bacterium]
MECWNCQSRQKGFFCDKCDRIQLMSEETDFFSCLGLDRKLNIDPSQAESQFHALSRKFHPDYFQDKSSREREISQDNASFINKAYRTLRDPVTRVEYLIRIERGSNGPVRAEAPPDLLEEVLELREKLEETELLKKGNDPSRLENAREGIKRELENLNQRLEAFQARFQNLSDEWDRLQDRARKGGSDGLEMTAKKGKVLEEFSKVLSHRTYLLNLVSEIRKVLE